MQNPTNTNNSNGIKPKEPNGVELDKWIGKVEEEITFLMTELNMMVVPLKEAEERYQRSKIEYEKVKSGYERKSEEIEKDKEFKDMLVRKREGYKSNKEIRQLTVTSATSKIPKKERKYPKAGKQMHWKEWTIGTLREAGKFMTPDDLFKVILDIHSDKFHNKRQVSKDRWSYINILLPGFHKTSVLEGQPRESGRKVKDKGVIVGYDVGGTKALKYGLREWVDENFVPRPKYIGEFMHDDKVPEGVGKIIWD